MIDAKTKFVAVHSYGINPDDLSGMAHEMQLLAERRAPLMNGFIECVIMANQERTQLVIVSLWESQHAWGAAQWDQEIGRVVAVHGRPAGRELGIIDLVGHDVADVHAIAVGLGELIGNVIA